VVEVAGNDRDRSGLHGSQPNKTSTIDRYAPLPLDLITLMHVRRLIKGLTLWFFLIKLKKVITQSFRQVNNLNRRIAK
jgi:hypothetical protein